MWLVIPAKAEVTSHMGEGRTHWAALSRHFPLFREDLRHIPECLELECVTARIEHEHRGLLTR